MSVPVPTKRPCARVPDLGPAEVDDEGPREKTSLVYVSRPVTPTHQALHKRIELKLRP